ncbi:MAG TPA: histidine ammonia-lyase [Casimicrobiaceae bacterium]
MTLRVGVERVTLADVARVAREGEPVALAAAARQRVADARAVVERTAADGPPVYGVNSALGANTGSRLPADDLAEYQRRAIRARAVGVGRPYDRASVRAMMFARIAGLAQGGSGISPTVLDALVAMLNRGVHPRVPRFGSIGVADLPQLSHLALPLIGEGEAEFAGATLPGATALTRAGLVPVALGAKDGLALISANAATVGRAALVATDALQLAQAWLAAIALSFEGFRANLSPIDPRAAAARAAPGQADVAQRLRALLAGSALNDAGSARRVQDPVSLRAVAQVHGALHVALDRVRDEVEIEMNSAAESPLVVDVFMLSNGNFHLPSLALTLDSAAIAFAQAASMGVERTLRFMTPALTDLPLQLTRHGPAHSGFATIQKTLTALWAEIRHRANPGSLDFLPVSESVEDHATMALFVVEKLGEIVERVRYVVAFELVVAAQAVDRRALDPGTLGTGARAAHAVVRRHVAFLDEDRPLGPDVERIAAALAAGAFGTTV